MMYSRPSAENAPMPLSRIRSSETASNGQGSIASAAVRRRRVHPARGLPGAESVDARLARFVAGRHHLVVAVGVQGEHDLAAETRQGLVGRRALVGHGVLVLERGLPSSASLHASAQVARDAAQPGAKAAPAKAVQPTVGVNKGFLRGIIGAGRITSIVE